MKWLVVRALVLSLIVSAFCAAAIGVGRSDPTPSPLQAVGLDLCAGDPCFRGIKPGMDWETFQQKFPEATTKDHGELGWITDMVGAQPVRVFPSPYQKFVMTIDMGDYPGILPFSIGDLITVFGSPCFIEMRGFQNSARLIYPTMYVYLDISAAEYNPNYRLPMDLPVSGLIMTSEAEKYRSCRTVRAPYADEWYGFTTTVIYRQRNLAAIGETAEPSGS